MAAGPKEIKCKLILYFWVLVTKVERGSRCFLASIQLIRGFLLEKRKIRVMHCWFSHQQQQQQRHGMQQKTKSQGHSSKLDFSGDINKTKILSRN